MIHLPLLQFADDTLLFCKYDLKMLLKLKNAIRLFEWCSGQKVNREKSVLSSVNMGEDELIQTANLLGCKAEKLPITYLGLPLGGYPRQKMFLEAEDIPYATQYWLVFPHITYLHFQYLKVWLPLWRESCETSFGKIMLATKSATLLNGTRFQLL